MLLLCLSAGVAFAQAICPDGDCPQQYVPLQPAHEGAWVAAAAGSPLVSVAALPDRVSLVGSTAFGGRSPHVALVDWRGRSAVFDGAGGQAWRVTAIAGRSPSCDALLLEVFAGASFADGFEALHDQLADEQYILHRAYPWALGLTKVCTVCSDAPGENGDCIDSIF